MFKGLLSAAPAWGSILGVGPELSRTVGAGPIACPGRGRRAPPLSPNILSTLWARRSSAVDRRSQPMNASLRVRLLALGLATLIVACESPRVVSPPNVATTERHDNSHGARPSIVLVHGAFADGSSWQRLIPLLQNDGYSVAVVQNNLASFADDVARTKRIIDAQTGPVIVVGHSYGGAVITDAAAGMARVSALIYLAAFAPDAGEPIGAFLGQFSSPLGAALRPDAAGFLYIDRALFRDVFAADVSTAATRVMAATQQPWNAAALGAAPATAAWRTIPSWYVVSKRDQAINPDLERFYAARMRAHTTEIESSHVSFISHPNVIARLIEDVATTVSARGS